MKEIYSLVLKANNETLLTSSKYNMFFMFPLPHTHNSTCPSEMLLLLLRGNPTQLWQHAGIISLALAARSASCLCCLCGKLLSLCGVRSYCFMAFVVLLAIVYVYVLWLATLANTVCVLLCGAPLALSFLRHITQFLGSLIFRFHFIFNFVCHIFYFGSTLPPLPLQCTLLKYLVRVRH